MAGFGGLNWQVLQLPLASGLNQKSDDRARPQPFLDLCHDAQFDEVGGLQTRYPFAVPAGSIFGGGSIANARRIFEYDNETVLFTDTQVYSWNAQLSAWVLRGTHLAVAVDEAPRVVSPGDQIDGDRAELAGTIVYAWTEATTVYAAALDKTTGSMLVAPTVVSTAVGKSRLVALASKILLFVDAGTNNMTVRAIDPATPGTGIAGAGTSVAAGTFNAVYDVVKVDGQDLCIGVHARLVTTSYQVFTVTPALTVTGATKARTADGVVGVSTTIGGGTQAQIVRRNGTNIQGDLLTTSTLADVFTAQAIGTAATTNVNQITIAFATSTTAYVFWTSGSVGETASFTDFVVKYNTVTTANAVGTQANFRHRLGIASRAFTYAGHAYVWLAFASDSGTSAFGNVSAVRAQLQHTYFLYRDDITLHSRCAYSTGGGFAASAGRLPGVALVSGSTGFAWCATVRRRIELGGQAAHTGFGARSPRDVIFTFDSDTSRRCARLGATLYITGGIPLQYDGLSISEVGFLIYPWSFEPQDGGAGLIGAGTYTWKSTLRWPNAKGDIDRSTTATGMSLTLAASRFVFLNYGYLNVTTKVSPRPPSIDFWRTAVAPNRDSPFYLASSQDPNAGFANNGYVQNVDTLDANTPLQDNFADATLITKETNPENGAVLEYLAPPGASILWATDTRLFLAGISGDPDRIWYSRERASNEVASFHDSLTTDVPRDGGAITSIIVYDGTLFAFRETAIYALPGTGKDNLGKGSNFGPARIVSLDVGAVSHEAVAITPLGVIFKSRKGWQLLGGNGSVRYIGDKVSDFDAETISAVHVVEKQHQVRILSASRLLIWDYFANQWGDETITDGVHAAMINGSHVYLATTGTRTQLATYTGLTYGLDVETAWIKPADLQGALSCRLVQLLGEVRSACSIWIRVAYNYVQTYVDSKVWEVAPTTVGGPLQVKHGLKQPKCESFKVRITAVAKTDVDFADDRADLRPAIDGPIVTTSGTPWAPRYQAVAAGETGNVITMSIGFETGPVAIIDVRDHLKYDAATATWSPLVNNVGVRVVIDYPAATLTGDTLTTMIGAGSALLHIAAGDPTPGKTIGLAMAGTTPTGAFSDGTFAAPSGEAIKLTGLGLEVGIEPGLFRRLPVAQTQ